MDSRVDPDLEAYATPSLDLSDPSVLAAARRLLAEWPVADVPDVAREDIDDGTVRGRLYRPDGAVRGGVLWFHGGALVAGAPAMDDEFCAETCRMLSTVVLSVDYRLAPEDPFPAALNDARAAWDVLRSLAPHPLVVGGQSAGGGLAAALVQQLVDAGDRPAAQWLWSPMLDDRTAAEASLDAFAHPVFDNRANRQAWQMYLGTAPGSPDVPPYAAAARREDLSGLPPTWMFTSDIDLFFAEDTRYVERLRAAGVPATLEVASGAPHGFEAQGRRSNAASRVLALGRLWLDGLIDAVA